MKLKPIQQTHQKGTNPFPLLFLVYINDIVDVVPETNLFMFAVDTTLIIKQKHLYGAIEIKSYVSSLIFLSKRFQNEP